MAFNPQNLPSLSGKVYLVTGGNAGIGFHTVRHLALLGGRVYMGARSPQKASDAIEKIRNESSSADVHHLQMDLMDLSSVVEAATSLKRRENRLNGLVNNAGIMATDFAISQADGFEAQWQTNYLSHWLLTWHLLDLLRETASEAEQDPGNARVVNVTSNGHKAHPKGGIDFDDINQEKGGAWSRYGMSKLGNVLHARQLNKLFGTGNHDAGKTAIWTASVHPGFIATDLNKQTIMPSFIYPTLKCLGVYQEPDYGSYSSLFTVASTDFKEVDSGTYFDPGARRGESNKTGTDMELADRLWTWTEGELRSRGLL
ncbi:hypothetical protein FSARC_7029 [Fusarium sarcochroum]|uniref:Reductase n=1 Tax=Fusarium sarcochroum TaxID=1208366 RepID=A0A8H4X7T1_9HYPO|nr:hypothetical protein FSARC_7029 [Fusarium sarcochroum]